MSESFIQSADSFCTEVSGGAISSTPIVRCSPRNHTQNSSNTCCKFCSPVDSNKKFLKNIQGTTPLRKRVLISDASKNKTSKSSTMNPLKRPVKKILNRLSMSTSSFEKEVKEVIEKSSPLDTSVLTRNLYKKVNEVLKTPKLDNASKKSNMPKAINSTKKDETPQKGVKAINTSISRQSKKITEKNSPNHKTDVKKTQSNESEGIKDDSINKRSKSPKKKDDISKPTAFRRKLYSRFSDFTDTDTAKTHDNSVLNDANTVNLKEKHNKLSEIKSYMLQKNIRKPNCEENIKNANAYSLRTNKKDDKHYFGEKVPESDNIYKIASKEDTNKYVMNLLKNVNSKSVECDKKENESERDSNTENNISKVDDSDRLFTNMDENENSFKSSAKHKKKSTINVKKKPEKTLRKKEDRVDRRKNNKSKEKKSENIRLHKKRILKSNAKRQIQETDSEDSIDEYLEFRRKTKYVLDSKNHSRKKYGSKYDSRQTFEQSRHKMSRDLLPVKDFRKYSRDESYSDYRDDSIKALEMKYLQNNCSNSRLELQPFTHRNHERTNNYNIVSSHLPLVPRQKTQYIDYPSDLKSFYKRYFPNKPHPTSRILTPYYKSSDSSIMSYNRSTIQLEQDYGDVNMSISNQLLEDLNIKYNSRNYEMRTKTKKMIEHDDVFKKPNGLPKRYKNHIERIEINEVKTNFIKDDVSTCSSSSMFSKNNCSGFSGRMPNSRIQPIHVVEKTSYIYQTDNNDVVLQNGTQNMLIDGSNTLLQSKNSVGYNNHVLKSGRSFATSNNDLVYSKIQQNAFPNSSQISKYGDTMIPSKMSNGINFAEPSFIEKDKEFRKRSREISNDIEDSSMTLKSKLPKIMEPIVLLQSFKENKENSGNIKVKEVVKNNINSVKMVNVESCDEGNSDDSWIAIKRPPMPCSPWRFSNND